MGPAVQTDGITRRYGDLVAVDHVDLEIQEGEVFGLLGPNGAGKTTLVSLLTTQLMPSSGSATVLGNDIQSQAHEVRSGIGVVFQELVIDEELTASEALGVSALLYDVAEKEKRMKEVLKLVGLHDERNRLVREFSGGMKRRLELARGLIHNPKVLFLDEPTLGLDPAARRRIWQHIRKLKRQGVTIFLTTHYLDEADALCDRIAIMNKGSIVVIDAPQNLKSALEGDIVRVVAENLPKSLLGEFEKTEWIADIKNEGKELRLVVKDGERRFRKVLKILHHHSADIRSLTLEKPSLEQVFFHYTGEEFR